MSDLNQTLVEYRRIRDIITSIESPPQIRRCERVLDNWLNMDPNNDRLIAASKLRQYLTDQVSIKFPKIHYNPR